MLKGLGGFADLGLQELAATQVPSEEDSSCTQDYKVLRHRLRVKGVKLGMKCMRIGGSKIAILASVP